MATINLGSIKFKWQGAYAGGTAYTVDDVVSYQGSSYICIQASTGNLPTNATYWEQMSSAGTDGTDLTTTLTTQGDIVYRDASGLARLGAGTAGQALISGGTGANPSWGAVAGGKVLQIVETAKSTTSSTSNTTYTATGHSATITPSATSSKILVLASSTIQVNSGGRGYYDIWANGTTISSGTGDGLAELEAPLSAKIPIAFHNLHSPNSTSAQTYEVYFKSSAGNTIYWSLSGDNSLTLIEIGA